MTSTSHFRGPLAKLAPRIEAAPAVFVSDLLGAYKRRAMAEARLRALLDEADAAYHAGSTPLLTDAAYDVLRDAAEAVGADGVAAGRAPRVGAPVPDAAERKVQLPFWMGSMDKLKDEKALGGWQAKYQGGCIASDKLDGVSALLVVSSKRLALYSRGDGRVGQDISGLLPLLAKGSVPAIARLPQGTAVRGELIVRRTDFEAHLAGRLANARNAVSGIVNATRDPDPRTAAVTRFVAYELVQPAGLPASEQLARLAALGFEVAYSARLAPGFGAPQLRELLLRRKAESPYEVDGIVVAHDAPGYAPVSGSNPEYAFAFKSADAHEVARAKVITVEWNASKDGLLKPTVVFEPVRLAGVTIQRATGHNAQFVEQHGIGPGARVEIVRSGDVIPYITAVPQRAPRGPQMPEQAWRWDARSTKDAALLDAGGNREVKVKQLAGFFKKLGARGVADKTIERLFDAGYDSVRRVLGAAPADIARIDGFDTAKAAATSEAVRAAVARAGCVELMEASNAFGAGFGERKLRAIVAGLGTDAAGLLARPPSVDMLIALPGVQQKTADGFLAGLRAFGAFAAEQGLSCSLQAPKAKPAPAAAQVAAPAPAPARAAARWSAWLDATFGSGRAVVFTGVRSPALEEAIVGVGGVVKTSVSSNTDVLVYADVRGKFEKAVSLTAERAKKGKPPITLVAWEDVVAQAARAGVALK